MAVFSGGARLVGMRVREFAKTVDHTLLKPDAVEDDVHRLCREAAHYHFASVCVLPCHVRLAARELRGTDVKVATVVSFPFGADSTVVKAAAVRDAIQGGASELDVVMNSRSSSPASSPTWPRSWRASTAR